MARRGLKPGQTTSTSWKPGQSGNPAGYPKAAIGWRESLRNDEYLRDLVRRSAIGQLTNGERKTIDKENLRYLLDQGFGRAPSIDAAAQVRAEMATIFAKLRERLGELEYIRLLGDLVDEPRALGVGIEPSKETDHG
jgi:hypothetical protein